MITLRNVRKRYDTRPVLQDISIDIRPGEITLLLGVNGAGKSTLLRCLLGLEAYDGRIDVAGFDPLADGAGTRALIGYMPQSGGLHGDLTVSETMRFYAAIKRAPEVRIAQLLTDAGLFEERDTRVGELSGGMRQRLGFAIAQLSDPPILLLDEPTASLDAASRQWLVGRLRTLAARGRTILVSTHAGQELFQADARFLAIEDGRLSEAASEAIHPLPDVTCEFTRGDWRPIVRKELRDALHNRWLAAYAMLLGLLGVAAAASGYDSVSGLSLQMFGRTTATLLNLSLLLAPLVAVLMGAASIAAERERGTLENLLAQPLSRHALLLAKHAGLLVALAAATVVGFFPAGVLIAANSGAAILIHYALFPALAIAAAAALAGVGLLVSVSSRSAVQAQGAAVAVWFTLALLYDLILIGSLAISGLAPHWLVAALALNPIDAARVIGVLALEPDLYLLGPAGAFLTESLGTAGAAVLLGSALCGWIGLPTAAATFQFSRILRRKKANDTRTSDVGVGSLGAGRDDRLRISGTRIEGA